MFKNIKTTITLAALSAFLFVGVAGAQSPPGSNPTSAPPHQLIAQADTPSVLAACVDLTTVEFDGVNTLNTSNIDVSDNPIFTTLIKIVNFLSIGVAIVASISVAIAGIQYMASRGNPSGTTAAVRRLTYVAIAIVMYVLGWALLNWLIPGGVINSTPPFADIAADIESGDVNRVNFCEREAPRQEPIFADAGTPPPPVTGPGGGTSGNMLTTFPQTVIFDGVLTEEVTQYANIKNDYKADVPDNMSWDANYAAGSVFIKYTISGKPTIEELKMQFCSWRTTEAGVKFGYETCSGQEALKFSSDGTYYRNLGQPAEWWTIDGAGFNWDTEPDVSRIMHKFSDNKLVQATACGNACSAVSKVSRNAPFTITTTIIVVAPGTTLVQPADWDCPPLICDVTTETFPGDVPLGGTFLPDVSPPGSRASILGPAKGWKIRSASSFVAPPFSSWSEEGKAYKRGTEIYDPDNDRVLYNAAQSSVKYLRNLADRYIVEGISVPSNTPAQIDQWISLDAAEALLPQPSHPDSPQAPGFGNSAAVMGGFFIAAADLEINVPGARTWYDTAKVLTDQPGWKATKNFRMSMIHMKMAAAKAGGFWDEVNNELLDEFRSFIPVSFRPDGVNISEIDRDRGVMYSTFELVAASEAVSIFRQSGMTVPSATITRLEAAVAWGVTHFSPAVASQPTAQNPYVFFDGSSQKKDVGPLTWRWGGWWRWAYQIGLTDVKPPGAANAEVLWKSMSAVPDWRGAGAGVNTPGTQF